MLRTGHKYHCTLRNFTTLDRRQSIGIYIILVYVPEQTFQYLVLLTYFCLFKNLNAIAVASLDLLCMGEIRSALARMTDHGQAVGPAVVSFLSLSHDLRFLFIIRAVIM